MKKFILMTILASGLLFVGVSFANAQNPTIPPGSYQQSCINIKVKGNILSASCNQSGGDKSFKLANNFEDFFLCADDIQNKNGTIICTKSNDAPLMKTAKAAFQSGFPLIHGRPFNGDGVVFVRDMFKTKTDMTKLFYSGLSSVSALQYLREQIRKPEEAQARLAVIDRAFKDVYGFAPQSNSVAFWNAEAAKTYNFYEGIVAAETKKLNTTGSDGKNPARRLMISSVYKKAMGRNANQEEITYWEKRPEIFKQIVEASRSWLYSSKGSTDLTETIKRALTEKKGGTAPNKDELNQAIIDYSKKKLIFTEM